MIQPLRNVHRRAFLALAVFLPGIMVLGLMARGRPVAIKAGSPEPPNGAALLTTVSAAWEKHSITTRFYGNPGPERRFEVVLMPEPPLNDSDVLLYWGSTATEISQAQLLGAFVPGKAYQLTTREHAGRLVLYSLAHREVVDRAKVEGLP